VRAARSRVRRPRSTDHVPRRDEAALTADNDRVEIAPVQDPAELAEIDKCEELIPLAEFGFARATRREDGSPAYGFTVGGEPPPNKANKLRAAETHRMNALAGQARRVLQVRCGGSRYVKGRKQSCRGVVAEWQHVVGGRRSPDGPRTVPQPEWDRRKEAWGDAAEPWCGWLVDAVSGNKYRDYQDGWVTMSCPRCGRQGIRIRLRRAQDALTASAETKTLEMLL
jgi:hypothetical protein